MVGRSHHAGGPLAGVLLDQVMSDLVHETVEKHEVLERLRGPDDSCTTEPFLDRRTGPPQALDSGFSKTTHIPR